MVRRPGTTSTRAVPEGVPELQTGEGSSRPGAPSHRGSDAALPSELRGLPVWRGGAKRGGHTGHPASTFRTPSEQGLVSLCPHLLLRNRNRLNPAGVGLWVETALCITLGGEMWLSDGLQQKSRITAQRRPADHPQQVGMAACLVSEWREVRLGRLRLCIRQQIVAGHGRLAIRPPVPPRACS